MSIFNFDNNWASQSFSTLIWYSESNWIPIRRFKIHWIVSERMTKRIESLISSRPFQKKKKGKSDTNLSIWIWMDGAVFVPKKEVWDEVWGGGLAMPPTKEQLIISIIRRFYQLPVFFTALLEHPSSPQSPFIRLPQPLDFIIPRRIMTGSENLFKDSDDALSGCRDIKYRVSSLITLLHQKESH